MSAVILRRIDAAQNMARFYLLDVQPDLFGGWSLIREWGRIGRAGASAPRPPALPGRRLRRFGAFPPHEGAAGV